MRRDIDYRVYLVTDRPACRGRPLEEVVLDAVRGGATLVQLREKRASSREFFHFAKLLVRELDRAGIPLIINDRADIALACGAAGLHIGQGDLPPEKARAILGPDAIIGLSVETRNDVIESSKLDVDYIAASPVFSTPTKTDAAPAWGLEGLAWVRDNSTKPVIAIGGIHSHNAKEVIMTGADGLAVVSDICSAPDPKQAARELRLIWEGYGPARKRNLPSR